MSGDNVLLGLFNDHIPRQEPMAWHTGDFELDIMPFQTAVSK